MKKETEKKPYIHFRVTAEEYRYLRDVAEAMDRSVSYLMASIIRDWIAKQKGEPEKT